jgi:hypothetical protein
MWAFAVALAAEEPVSDEVLVYGDDFARWDDTRWWVAHEVVLPAPLVFGADDDEEFQTFAAQVRMVLRCEKDGRERAKTLDVVCAVEDIGLLATTVRHHQRPRDQEVAQRVLDQLDAKLTGAVLQLQVDEIGGVNNLDIEGWRPRNLRERRIRENMRQLLLRAVAGYHLRIPDHAQHEGVWEEAHSTLMTLPSMTASLGSSRLVHTVSAHEYEGFAYQIVQTLGEASAMTLVPNFDLVELPPTLGEQGGLLYEPNIELIYRLESSGVAIVERATGVMSKRVWAVRGMPTASSGSGMALNNPYRNIGVLRLLGESDRPDVGPTAQVSWPLDRIEGLAPWIDLDAHVSEVVP